MAEPSDGDLATRAQVDAGLRLLHEELAAARRQQEALQATVTALTATLTAHGLLPTREFERRRTRAMSAAEYARDDLHPAVQLAPDRDKYALGTLPDIDCATLMPLCKGRCCKLTVWCTRQDLDERVVQWDYAAPYRLRVRSDGYCVHSDAETRGCGVYAARPATCRTYDCRGDARIWIDFARRIPAPE